MPEIVQLLVSPIHRFEGRPSTGPAPAPPGELVGSVQVRAQLGLVGDRYFGHRAHRDAAVTLIAQESLPVGADLSAVRRNVLTRGIEVDALVGKVLVLDSGDGPVQLRVARAAPPCGWLDVSVGPGTRALLRGHGGIRCVPLNDGLLRVGAVVVSVREP